MSVILGGIHPYQLKYNVVTPVLNYLNLGGSRAINLITGTIFSESYIGNFTHLKQQNNGPALGIIQMELATYNDIWNNYLKYKSLYSILLKSLAGDWNTDNNNSPKYGTIIGNLYFAVGMCRIHYLRKPEQIPEYNNAQKLAEYYKKHYNTPLGKAVVSEKVKYFQEAINL